MPRGLKRYQEDGDLHFITFSCYQRRPLLEEPQARSTFEEILEQVRQWYGLLICGYVVMPEHVHLLVSEPERGTLAAALQTLKQTVSHKLGPGRPHPVRDTAADKDGAPICEGPFWYTRYYDFNVWTEKKRIEKLKYMHRNPVKRGLVEKPEDWAWSSFRHYAERVEGTVKIGE